MSLTTNKTKLQTLLDGINALPVPEYQSKTVTPTTSSQTVSPDDGYDALTSVTVNAMPTGSTGTTSISVSSGGLVTATPSISTAGYISSVASSSTATKQLTTQAAKTVTPTKSSQTAVASGRYTTGAVTVAAIPDKYEDRTESLPQLNTVNGGTAATTMAAAVDNTETLVEDEAALITQLQTALEGTTYDPSGLQKKIIQPMVDDQIITADSDYQALSQVTVKGDTNLSAGNIKSGVSIFGVAGSYEGSGNGGGSAECQVATGTFTISECTESNTMLARIDGLPFIPKFVLCILSSSFSTMSTSVNQHFVGFSTPLYDENFEPLDALSGSAQVIGLRGGVKYTFVPYVSYIRIMPSSSAGFTVDAGAGINSTNVVVGGTYNYYAIG